MNEFLMYLMKSSICLAALYMIYWFFLKKDTFFMANRIYLISSIIFSFVLPLFKIPIVIADSELTYIAVMETITITAQKVESGILNNLSIYQKLFIVYLTGVAIFSLRFIIQISQLFLLIRKFGVTNIDGLKVVKLDRKYSPFSYFNYVFLNEENLKDKNLQEIIDHEKIHIEQKHSIDLVLLEALTIIQWFNPFIWLYKTSIKGIHEYLADEGLLAKGTNKLNYQNLLLNQTVGVQINDLTNNFNQSLIKKRFIMMTKKQSKRSAGLKLLLIIPVTALLVMCFTFSYAQQLIEKVVDKEQVETVETSTALKAIAVTETSIVEQQVKDQEQIFTVVEKMPSFLGGPVDLFNFLSKNIKYPSEARKNKVKGRVYVSFVVEKNGSLSNIKVLRGIGSGCNEEAIRVVKSMPKWNPGKQRGKIVRVQYNLPIRFPLEGISIKKIVPVEVTDDVFTVVETTPQFKGGEQALYKYLGENIKYPEEAQKNNIEGRVYVQFVVEKNGELTGFKVLKGIGNGCDEEAIRVVATMPNWIPGIQRGQAVRVQFNLPIRFMLNNGSDPVEAPKAKTDDVFTVVEDMPYFTGGEKAMYKFLAENINYPKEAHEIGIEGRVDVSFVVEKDGSISTINILRNASSGLDNEAIIVTALRPEKEDSSISKSTLEKSVHPSLDKEAIRLVKLMPKWIPGKQRGKAVRVVYTLPIHFSLK